MKIYNLNRTSIQKVLKDWTTDRAFDYQALINFDYAKLDKAQQNLIEQIKLDIENKSISQLTIQYLESISISISILNDDNNLLLASPDIYQYQPANFNGKYVVEILTSLIQPIIEKLYTTADIFPTHFFHPEYTTRQEEIQNDKRLNLFFMTRLVVKAINEMLVMLRRFRLQKERKENE